MPVPASISKALACVAGFIPHCQLVPIPSLWGHPAGAGASPQDATFINQHVTMFLSDVSKMTSR
jgi:homoserine O-acetyltransferase